VNKKNEKRQRRKTRARFYINGTDERPRLNVFRSNKHMYAQVINDAQGITLASVGTLSAGVKDAEGGMVKRANAVGKALAALCMEKGIKKVVFDKNGFIYKKGGTIDALATGAREGGLDF
jgi:large subunit ribosomal protein L18